MSSAAGFYRFAASVLFSFLLSACAGPSASLSGIEPVGIDMRTEKPVVTDIQKGSPADGVVSIGDTITEINGQPLASRQDWVDYITSTAGKADALDDKIILVGQNNTRKEVTHRQLGNPFGNDVYVTFGQSGVVHKLADQQRNVPAGLIRDQGLTIMGRLGAWNTTPSVLQAEIAVTASKGCKKCSIDGISLYSVQIEKELPLVPPDTLAYLVFQPLSAEKNPGRIVPVPAPTLTGFSSTTFTSGSIGQTYPGPVGGPYSFSATSNTVTRPMYDYSAQNAAVIGNAVSSIRNKNAAQQMSYRQQFAISHGIGTLSTGTLQPGKAISGTLLFQNLGGSTGPFELRIKRGDMPMIITFGGKPEPIKEPAPEEQAASEK